MFGIGTAELVVILILVLIFVGPKKLPDLAKAIGKGLREFKRAQHDFRESISLEADKSEDSPKQIIAKKDDKLPPSGTSTPPSSNNIH